MSTPLSSLSSTPAAAFSAKSWFVKLGILPFLLAASILYFAGSEPRFLSGDNLFNVARQSTFLIIVAMGQMIVIVTAGLDLSAGSIIGFSGVVAALALNQVLGTSPEAIWLSIAAAVGAGLCAGLLVGAINGFGARRRGQHLGLVVRALPRRGVGPGVRGTADGRGRGVGAGRAAFHDDTGHHDQPDRRDPEPDQRAAGDRRARRVHASAGLRPRAGHDAAHPHHHRALRAGLRAAQPHYDRALLLRRRLQRPGISTRKHVFLAYLFAGLLAAVAGVLFVARTGSAEAMNGQPYTLQAIAACVIGGVSLFGGMGRVRDVLLGALFITILTNGMNLVRVESYVQQIVLGAVLIVSLVADQLRLKWLT